jgi:glycosyltransferase involved in cell wall biosynthesis
VNRSPLFSIVIPSLNRGVLLDRCLESICAQDFTDVEIIVVDAGSTDGTSAVLRKYAPRVRAIVENGIGVSDARNAGVRDANGRFIVFVDSDDLLLGPALRLYASLIGGQDPPRLILAAFETFSDERELAVPLQANHGPDVRRFATYLDAAEEGHLSGTHRLIIERAAYLDAGGLDPGLRVCEDQDFGLRINQCGPCLLVVAPATIGYRQHGGNISGSAASFGFGARWLVRNERRGAYPGGAANQAVRRAVITRTARSASLACLDQGHLRQAVAIYGDTCAWHLAQARVKYLVGFPVKAFIAAITGGAAARTLASRS